MDMHEKGHHGVGQASNIWIDSCFELVSSLQQGICLTCLAHHLVFIRVLCGSVAPDSFTTSSPQTRIPQHGDVTGVVPYDYVYVCYRYHGSWWLE